MSAHALLVDTGMALVTEAARRAAETERMGDGTGNRDESRDA